VTRLPRGLTGGTPHVLRKPFTFAELSARVAELLGPHGER
jgi:DNA-binding response OmpR family regulator